MATLTQDRLRRLAETGVEHGRVLSVFMNLDPREFATPPARASQITSLVDEAHRRVADAVGVDHDVRTALAADVERIEAALRDVDLAQNGTQGVAVYASSTADLFEVVRLPHPVEPAVVLERTPHVAPLAAIGSQARWCVVLCNRSSARIFYGPGSELTETDRIEDEVHQQHDQGGWSQARYQRSVDEEVFDHLRHVADVLFTEFKRRPFDHLLVGAPVETVDDLETRLHPYLRERLAGRLQIDVDNTTVDDVRAAAAVIVEEVAVRHERARLDRFKQGVGRGIRAAAGREEVGAALDQAAVEVLLVDHRGDFEDEIERALAQAAEIVVVSRHPDLGPHEGIGAVLRF